MDPSDEHSKPAIPYAKGWQFRVQAHTAPPPTPVTHGCCHITKQETQEKTEFSQLEWCCRYPPLPGQTGTGSVHLEVLDAFQVRDGCNAQVFTAQVLQASSDIQHLQQGMTVVAKMYDPLYFDDDEGFVNPFRCVDKHYTHEARVYNVLSDMQGWLIPKFYGSYTLDIPVEGLGHREVRLILIEYIPSKSMQQLHPKDFSQSARKQIMKGTVDFETMVYYRDIGLTDQHPRNVLIVQNGNLETDPDSQRKLIFIDFAGALLGRTRDDPMAKKINMFYGQYISPLLRWKQRMMRWDFDDWIDWDWDSWIDAEYAHTAPTITPEMQERFGPPSSCSP